MTLTDIKTRKAYEISNYDGESGAPDYMADIIGNTGAVARERMERVSLAAYKRIATNSKYIVCDEAGNRYTTLENIEFWQTYVGEMERASKAQESLMQRIDENVIDCNVEDIRESIRMAAQEACDTDYESHGARILQALHAWIDEHVTSDDDKPALHNEVGQ